jgi:hypothetical protein
MTQSHSLGELMPNKAFGGVQSVQRLLGFVIISIHADEHASGFSARRKHNLRHCSEPNPGIAKLALEDKINLLAQCFYPPLALVFRRARLNHEKLPLR